MPKLPESMWWLEQGRGTIKMRLQEGSEGGERLLKLKVMATVLLGVLMALGITLGAGIALASGHQEGNHEHGAGDYEANFSSDPRFPVMGEEAELTFMVTHDGSPVEGLTLVLGLTRGEVGHAHGDEAAADPHDDDAVADHHDDETVADDHDDETVADDHDDEAVADDHDEADSTEAGSVEIAVIETAPGVYMAKYTFEEAGKYVGTAQIGEEPVEVGLSVRSEPVDWSFIAGLGGITLLVAGMVVVIKSVRKEW